MQISDNGIYKCLKKKQVTLHIYNIVKEKISVTILLIIKY